jgi:hypothetical protein
MVLSAEARWRWAIVVLPLVMAALLLGRVWTHHFGYLGSDQLLAQRIVGNAWGTLCAPGSAPWTWPAQAPGCAGDPCLGLAVMMAPWYLVGVPYPMAMWFTIALTLALNGTLLALLLQRWGLSPVASGAAAVMAAGLPVLVQRLLHVMNLEMFWVLAWVIAFDAWWERARPDRWRSALLALAGLGLAIMPATVLQFSAPSLAVLALITVIRPRPPADAGATDDGAAPTRGPRGWAMRMLALVAAHAPAALLWWWIYRPYLDHSYPPNVVIPTPWQDLLRPLGVVAWPQGVPQADSLATPGPVPVLGVVGLVLAVVVGRWRAVAACLLVMIAGDMVLAMTFGSWSPIDDLRGLPLFSGTRSPARFAIPAGILAVAGLAMLLDVVAARRPWLAVALAALAVAGQMRVDGGPVVPLHVIASPVPDLRAVSAAAPPGPVLAMPTGIFDDVIGLATGRVTVGTSNGRPTDWQTQLDSGDPTAIAANLVALHRLGMAGVITLDDRAAPTIAVMHHLGARALATGIDGMTWWALPPAPPGPWSSAMVLARRPQGWHLTITGDPGAAPIEGWLRAGGQRWNMVPFLPGTRQIDIDLPGSARPTWRFSRDIPITVDDGAGAGH